MTYGRLAPVLHDAALALHNLASLPHISVGGAIADGHARLGRPRWETSRPR